MQRRKEEQPETMHLVHINHTLSGVSEKVAMQRRKEQPETTHHPYTAGSVGSNNSGHTMFSTVRNV